MLRPIRRALCGALAALLLGAQAQAETLADALADAYQGSGLIEQNRALLRAADESVAQAVAALRPVVSWVADAQALWPDPNPFGSTYAIGDIGLSATLTLQADLLLFDGGGSRLAVDQQKETVLATRERLRAVEQQVLLRAVEAYLELLRVGEFVALRESNVRLITQELRAARDRFEVGEVTRTDVALAEARLAAAQSQLAAEQGALVRAVEEFRAAVGRAPAGPAPAPQARIPFGLAEARAFAQRHHPALREVQHQVAAAEIGIARAEASLRPQVTLRGQLGIDQDLEEGAGVGLRATAPLYQGGRLASVIREAQARRDAARADLLETARQVDQNVANAFSFLDVARAGRSAFEEQVRAATAAFEGVREEALLGARTTLDVLDAEQDLLDARTNLVSASADETVATYAVLAAVGLLTAQDLGLDVPIFDPTAYFELVDDAPAALSEQGRALDRVLEAIGVQ
jgi:outer membrane protein